MEQEPEVPCLPEVNPVTLDGALKASWHSETDVLSATSLSVMPFNQHTRQRLEPQVFIHKRCQWRYVVAAPIEPNIAKRS